jgi:hypothetical protein
MSSSPEFPSNSRKVRGPQNPEKPQVQQVVKGEAVRRKKPLGRRLKELIFGGADGGSVWEYVTQDVLVPAAKDTLVDVVREGIERMVFGEATARRSRSRNRPGETFISYNRYSGGGRREESHDRHRTQMSRRGRARHDFDEIILPTRHEADEVIERLFDLISQYEIATVSDLYDLVGLQANYTDDKWGWTELPGAGVSRVRSGYLLDLPRPIPLD